MRNYRMNGRYGGGGVRCAYTYMRGWLVAVECALALFPVNGVPSRVAISVT